MPRFVTFTTDTNEDVQLLTESEYRTGGLPDDWAEYVWTDAPDRETACAMHDQHMAEYEADVKSGRPIPHAYDAHDAA